VNLIKTDSLRCVTGRAEDRSHAVTDLAADTDVRPAQASGDLAKASAVETLATRFAHGLITGCRAPDLRFHRAEAPRSADSAEVAIKRTAPARDGQS
jgi:hypothetical protein